MAGNGNKRETPKILNEVFTAKLQKSRRKAVGLVRLMETIWRDSLYALRTMRKNPVFAATAVITLALAIGGNAAMFTVMRPLH